MHKNVCQGLFYNSHPFLCKITLRSQEKVDIIKQQYSEATSIFLKYEEFLDKAEKTLLVKESVNI